MTATPCATATAPSGGCCRRCWQRLPSRGERAEFEVDDAGRVLRLKLDENYTYPVTDWGT